jgi:NADH-quinone oxidoreductase subunit M
MWVFFDYDTSGFFFLFNLPVLENYNIFCTFGVDGISLFFLLITVLLFPICFLAS